VVNWDLEFAPAGYQYLSLLDPAAAVENPQHDGYMMFRMFADLDFTVRVTTLLHLNTSFLYLRTEQPFPRSDGTIPKQNDYQIVFGISLRIG
jgi:hypothetical protein